MHTFAAGGASEFSLASELAAARAAEGGELAAARAALTALDDPTIAALLGAAAHTFNTPGGFDAWLEGGPFEAAAA